MEMPIKVSVIVPIYNVEQYIQKCLDSLINQTYPSYEILLIDDGSKDGSSEIARSYANKFDNVSYHRKINGGLSDARNFGIERARGDFLMFIDSDDFVDGHLIEKMMEMQSRSKADIVACDMMYAYEDGRNVIASAGDFDLGSAKDDIKLIRINNSACNKLFHHNLFKDIRFPLGKLYEDLFVVPILIYRSKLIAHVKEPLYFYLQREGSIVHKNNQRMFHIYEAIHHVYSILLVETDSSSELKQVIENMYIEHGLHLTTLRIKENGDFADRIKYFRLNIEQLEQYFSNWYDDESLKTYPTKSRIIFFLFKQRMYWLVALLLKRN